VADIVGLYRHRDYAQFAIKASDFDLKLKQLIYVYNCWFVYYFHYCLIIIFRHCFVVYRYELWSVQAYCAWLDRLQTVCLLIFCWMVDMQNGSSRIESVMRSCLVPAARPLHQRLALARCPSSMMPAMTVTVNSFCYVTMLVVKRCSFCVFDDLNFVDLVVVDLVLC